MSMRLIRFGAVVGLFAVLFLAATGSTAAQAPVLPGRIYQLDKSHSMLSFTARHAGFARVRGAIKDYRVAAYMVDNDLTRSSVTAIIDVSSIDTGHAGRDAILRDEFFKVSEFPTIRFQSQSVERTADGYLMTGNLTIRNVTKSVRLPMTMVAMGPDQFEHHRAVFETAITVNRKDYGVIYGNEFWDKIASDDIRIEIEVSVRHYNALNTIFPWRNSVGKVLLDAAQNEGPDAVRARAARLWKENREEYNFGLSQFYRAGVGLAQQGKFDAAVAVLEAGLEIQSSATPQDAADMHVTLAEVHAQAGRRALAAQHITRALSLDPANPAALELARYLK